MGRIRTLVDEAIRSGFLSTEAEQEIWSLQSERQPDLDDLMGIIILQQGILSGRIQKEQENTEDGGPEGREQ